MDKSRKLGSNRVTSALALPSIFFLALVLLSFYLSARVYIGARACSCKEKKKVDEAGSGRVREKERERERERDGRKNEGKGRDSLLVYSKTTISIYAYDQLRSPSSSPFSFYGLTNRRSKCQRNRSSAPVLVKRRAAEFLRFRRIPAICLFRNNNVHIHTWYSYKCKQTCPAGDWLAYP